MRNVNTLAAVWTELNGKEWLLCDLQLSEQPAWFILPHRSRAT